MRSIARRLLSAEKCGENTELSIVLTDDASIRELNREYRETDAPTDVLAFSQVEGDEFVEAGEEHPLGDVVISVETAARQAAERGYSLEDEIDLLLAHGILHLLGYDHEEMEHRGYASGQEAGPEA